MEATAGSSVTTSLEHNIKESKYIIVTHASTKVPSETAEEGSEPNDHYTSYSGGEEDSGTVYDDVGLCGNFVERGFEFDDADGYDDYNKDEEAAYDKTEANKSSYDRDDAAECEEEDEDSEDINEENGVTQLPMANFSDISGHEGDGSGEIAHASSEAGPEGSNDDWSTEGNDAKHSYTYVYYPVFLSSPPDVQYALQRHMVNVFEASFHRFGHHHFGEDLKSEEWRQEILTDRGVGRLPKLLWDKVHAVEVKDWIKFVKRVQDAKLLSEDALADLETFSPPDPNPAMCILGMANYIRDTTFHRDEPVIESQLKKAAKIPRVLKDQKRAEELEAIYEIIVNDPELDAPSSQWVRNILFPPQPESSTCLEVHAKILKILEEGCFYFAQREDREILTRKFWTEPEHGEMQKYARHWESTPSEYRVLANAMKTEECANLDGQFFLHQQLREIVMSKAINLRNKVSHRDLVNERSVCYSAWNTILCFILMDDRIRAIEVESLVEAFLTKMSQTDALVRLYNASWNDEPARRQAIVEICRRDGIEADQLYSPKREFLPVPPRLSPGIGSRWPEILTNDEKWKFWRSVVQKFVFCDSMHETLMRERPIEQVET